MLPNHRTCGSAASCSAYELRSWLPLPCSPWPDLCRHCLHSSRALCCRAKCHYHDPLIHDARAFVRAGVFGNGHSPSPVNYDRSLREEAEKMCQISAPQENRFRRPCGCLLRDGVCWQLRPQSPAPTFPVGSQCHWGCAQPSGSVCSRTVGQTHPHGLTDPSHAPMRQATVCLPSVSPLCPRVHRHRGVRVAFGDLNSDFRHGPWYPPLPCKSYALVQATAGVGTVLIWYLI